MDGERHRSVESGRGGIDGVEQQPWAQPQGKAKEAAGKASCIIENADPVKILKT